MGWDTFVKEGVETDRNTLNDSGERVVVKAYGIKLAKADVNYTAEGDEDVLCADCRFYNRAYYYGNEAGIEAGNCNLVEGSIDPDGSCDEYANNSGPFN